MVPHFRSRINSTIVGLVNEGLFNHSHEKTLLGTKNVMVQFLFTKDHIHCTTE